MQGTKLNNALLASTITYRTQEQKHQWKYYTNKFTTHDRALAIKQHAQRHGMLSNDSDSTPWVTVAELDDLWLRTFSFRANIIKAANK